MAGFFPVAPEGGRLHGIPAISQPANVQIGTWTRENNLSLASKDIPQQGGSPSW